MSLPPRLRRIGDYVEWHASRTPEATALAFAGTRLTYEGLRHEVDALAASLVAAGIGKGDRVASLHPPNPLFVIDFLATASIGAIWVGLNPRYRLPELLRVVRDCTPSALLTRLHVGGRDFTAEAAAMREACPSIRHLVTVEPSAGLTGAVTRSAFLRDGECLDAGELSARRHGCGDRDPCLIVYTSGSTGEPKGALLHHEGLALFALGQNQIWPVERYVGLNYFPINHVGSVADCTLPALVAGGALHFLEQFEPRDCLSLMVRERVSIWGSVPGTFPMIMDLPEYRPEDLSSVELIVWGGAAMAETVIRRLLQVTNRLATNYGLTEATSAITVVPPTADVEILANSVGSPFPGVEVRLAGADGEIVPAGAVGEVQARSPLNFLGYWNRPEATEGAFAEGGWLRTGDLAIRRPDAAYRLVGRIREMFKSGGYNVYPREVEQVLEACPGVTAAALVSLADPVWQEVGVAFVVGAASADELALWLRERLANYKVPKRFHLVDRLPLLPIGKVDKQALRERAEELAAEGGA